MPLPVIANTYRCALNWHHSNGQHAVNVTHVLAAAVDSQDIMDALDAHVTANMWQAVGDGAAVDTVVITPLDGSSAATTYSPATPSHWTGGTGGNVIIQEACLVKAQTGLRGPAHRGRLFLPFVAESAQTDGRIASGNVTAMQTAWDTFLADMVAGDRFPVVASYVHSSAQAIDSYVVEAESGTQRRRQQRNR